MDTLLTDSDLDRIFQWPSGRARRMVKAGKLTAINLPDGSLRFRREVIKKLIGAPPRKGAGKMRFMINYQNGSSEITYADSAREAMDNADGTVGRIKNVQAIDDGKTDPAPEDLEDWEEDGEEEDPEDGEDSEDGDGGEEDDED